MAAPLRPTGASRRSYGVSQPLDVVVHGGCGALDSRDDAVFQLEDFRQALVDEVVSALSARFTHWFTLVHTGVFVLKHNDERARYARVCVRVCRSVAFRSE